MPGQKVLTGGVDDYSLVSKIGEQYDVWHLVALHDLMKCWKTDSADLWSRPCICNCGL